MNGKNLVVKWEKNVSLFVFEISSLPGINKFFFHSFNRIDELYHLKITHLSHIIYHFVIFIPKTRKNKANDHQRSLEVSLPKNKKNFFFRNLVQLKYRLQNILYLVKILIPQKGRLNISKVDHLTFSFYCACQDDWSDFILKNQLFCVMPFFFFEKKSF